MPMAAAADYLAYAPHTMFRYFDYFHAVYAYVFRFDMPRHAADDIFVFRFSATHAATCFALFRYIIDFHTP